MVSVDGVLSRPRKGWTCFTQALPQTGGASIHGDSGKKRATIELKGRPGDVPWVVQLSDLHLSVHHPKRALDFKAILGPTLAMVKPSLVFITGDLTDGKSKDLLTMKQDEAGWVEYHKVIDDAIKRSGLKRSSFYDLRGNHDSFGVPNTDGSFDFYSKYSINAQLGRRGSISSVTVQMIWSAFKPTRPFGNNLTTDELKLTMEDGAWLWKIDCGSICVFVAVPLSQSPRFWQRLESSSPFLHQEPWMDLSATHHISTCGATITIVVEDVLY